MKDLTKYFIDLSKCTKEQQNHLEKLTNYKYIDNFYSHLYFTGFQWMGCTSCHVLNNGKTELTYPEFIKLFEDGEDYPGKRYQPLFDHLNQEHGLLIWARCKKNFQLTQLASIKQPSIWFKSAYAIWFNTISAVLTLVHAKITNMLEGV